MAHGKQSAYCTKPPIHILDDDSLLKVFYLYCPFLQVLGEDELEEDNARIAGGNKGWGPGAVV